jgi:hypothetical protein
VALMVRSSAGFVAVVDHANLVFREVGHSLVAYFNPNLAAYGGAIGQLALPCITALSFRRQGNVLGTATSVAWLCENLINIAHNLSDPGAKSPPLIGGADLDWPIAINHLRLLRYEPNIVMVLTLSGWTGLATVPMWVLWRAWQSRHRPAVSSGSLAASAD